MNGTTPQRLRLSVLLCTYNDARKLPRALDAILGQDRAPDEVVVVDDGSTDDTGQVLDRYRPNHPSLRTIALRENVGVVEAGRVGLAAVTGDFVYWASANDQVLPGFFAAAMDLLSQHPATGALVGQIEFQDVASGASHLQQVKAWRETRAYSPEEFHRDYLGGEWEWFSLGPSCIYRRQALIDAGGIRPELGAFSDSFAVRAMGLAHGICYLARPCARFYVGGRSYSDRLYRDPEALLAVAEHARRLMTTPPLSRVFPAGYAAAWHRRCVEGVAADQVGQFDEHHRRLLLLVAGQRPSPSGPWRLAHRLFRWTSAVQRRAGGALLRWRLSNHRVPGSDSADSPVAPDSTRGKQG